MPDWNSYLGGMKRENKILPPATLDSQYQWGGVSWRRVVLIPRGKQVVSEDSLSSLRVSILKFVRIVRWQSSLHSIIRDRARSSAAFSGFWQFRWQ